MALLLVIFSVLSAELIDLNTATLDEIMTLPITERQALDIYEYRVYESFFSSVYDLRKLDSIDQQTFLRLKPLVRISHYSDLDDAEQRREEIGYLIERLGSNEGSQEGTSDVWEDYLITPRNVNRMFFSDLLNFPNVSPQDAASVRKRVAKKDTITSWRDLRNTGGASYYGMRNLRNYVYYNEPPVRERLFFDYQFKYSDAPPEDDEEEAELTQEASSQDNRLQDDYEPEIMNKLRIRYGNNWKAGMMIFNRKGEEGLYDRTATEMWEDGKFYVGYEDFQPWLFDSYLKVYIGNYRATYGEGLVMENTDFYSSRKTGMGFSKRITGIIGDLSRTREYALRGGAVEWKHDKFNVTAFGSYDEKDAVLYDDNEDGKFGGDDDMSMDNRDRVFSYITVNKRPDSDSIDPIAGENLAVVRDALKETILGTHVEYSPFIGTHVGFTAYEARYNRYFYVPSDMDELEEVLLASPAEYDENGDLEDAGDSDKVKIPDSEILAQYSSYTDDYKRDYRRVYGLDFGTTLDFLSIQGEYAELETDGAFSKVGDDPHAVITSAYTQFDNLNFLALYRNYDLDFDNPYARGFSEHEKFDDTMFDKYDYILTNTDLVYMYLNSAQAQAEEGVYIETRYQFSRYLTINRAYLDIWERKCDSRRSVRFQGELEFKPYHQLRIRPKYKHQVNRYDDYMDRAVSTTDEYTIQFRALLSKRDFFQLEYRYNQVEMPPYPYLTNTPESGDDTLTQGTVLIHGDYINVDYTHYFTDNFKVKGAFLYWDGHGISHWDWEDMEIDFMGERGYKYWFAVQDRISKNVWVSIKYKYRKFKTKVLDLRQWDNSEYEGEPEFTKVEKEQQSIRLQIDWKF